MEDKWQKLVKVLTSSLRLDTKSTFDKPRNAPGFAELNAPVEVNVNAPMLGIPPLYAFAIAVGVPSPIAVNGGKTPGPPIPFTIIKEFKKLLN